MKVESFKDQLIFGLRQDLNTSIVELAKEILSLADDFPEKQSVINLTFSEVFNISSIHSQDECLAEMIKPRNLIRIQNKDEHGVMQGLKIKDIENLLRCDRPLILKTLESLEMRGGMNGWRVESSGVRRGKTYCLKKETT
jgi:hypothetical protein